MEGTTKTIKLLVDGIVCTGCAMDMETILLDTDGIEDAEVKFVDGIITIDYDPELIDQQQVYLRVQKLGYKTTIIE